MLRGCSRQSSKTMALCGGIRDGRGACPFGVRERVATRVDRPPRRRGASADKVDEIANTVPEEIKSCGKLDRRREHSVHAQRIQRSQREDRRLRRRFDERDRVDARPDHGISRSGLRQDHPVDSGRHLQRRHVVVHRHEGARGSRSTSSPTSRRAFCGRSVPTIRSTRTTHAGRRFRYRPPRPRKPTNCRPRARRALMRASRRSRSFRSTGRTRRRTRWCSVRWMRCRQTHR